MAWKNDVASGKRGEEAVESVLSLAGFVCERSKGRFGGWDILAADDQASFTVECKNDLRAPSTGNVAIEIWNTKSGEPSGLTATSADLWAHVVGGEVFLSSVSSLRSYVSSAPPVRTVNGAGDGNASVMLYRSDDVLGPVLRPLRGMDGPTVRSLVLSLLLSARSDG